MPADRHGRAPHLGLGFDMRSPDWGAPTAALYAAAVEMAEWADGVGFETVVLNEHHNTDDGYLPSPLVLGGGMATRTRDIEIVVSALVVTLHHPLRAAEDLAVLDLLSAGRVSVVLGAGYRVPEYQMFGVDWKRRPSMMEEAVRALRLAWTGEPFEFRGATVRVLPRPARPGGPPLALAGASDATARRAARLGLPYQPVSARFYEVYLEELGRLGRDIPAAPGFLGARAGARGPTFLHVSEDPDAAWARIAPHALHHTNTYASWAPRKDLTPFKAVTDAGELRRNGSHEVLTPDQCVELCRRLGPDGRLSFMPLLGGLDPELAWDSLRLFETKVLPRL
jgi:alkanesulfonate monooxygenase SsuD/methylene tetrahydromethanopterin reductase-like flavin-dependent oxidoreductase (luciferase family)